MLGVLLCYNDGDLLEDSIRYLLDQRHDLVVWDHGSTDETASVIDRFRSDLLERRFVPREFDFYDLYPAMSGHLMDRYVASYDWVSWPDQDELLEGPSRAKPYHAWLQEVHDSPHSWIQFNNFNYWFTSADDPAVRSALQRVRHYALFPDCAPRIRSWRASATNVRVFNHNPPEGTAYPKRFNLRHYPARSREQNAARVLRDRAGLQRGEANFHYENMKAVMDRTEIRPEQLHFDDGRSELDPTPAFNWRTIYGYGPRSPVT
jgi:glycosyltransferase involved in cell wall biosynthesis